MPHHRITPAQQSAWRDEYWFVHAGNGRIGNILGRFVVCRNCMWWEPPKSDKRGRGICKPGGFKVGRAARCSFFEPSDETLTKLEAETAAADAAEIPNDSI